MSTNFTIEAVRGLSQVQTGRLPGHAGPAMTNGKPSFPFGGVWSGKRGSNSRPQPWQGCALPTELFPQKLSSVTGGAIRSRTGLDGFAIRCITALLSRLCLVRQPCSKLPVVTDKKGKPGFPFRKLERETRFELATSTLARLRSTN